MAKRYPEVTFDVKQAGQTRALVQAVYGETSLFISGLQLARIARAPNKEPKPMINLICLIVLIYFLAANGLKR